MYEFELFKLTDLEDINVTPRYQYAKEQILVHAEHFESRLVTEFSWTIYKDSVPIGAAGILRSNYAWALLGQGMFSALIPCTRFVSKVLYKHLESVGPVFADVDTTYRPAVRWVQMLGFEAVGPSHLEGMTLWRWAPHV